MFSSLSRLFTYAVVDFGRNIWLSVTTVLILTLTLASVQVLLAVNVAGAAALAELESRVDLRVQFRPEIGEDEVDTIRTTIARRSEVVGVEHIARARVLVEFQASHEGNDAILEALAELGENPFGPELRIRVRHPEDFAAMTALLREPALAEKIVEASAGDRSALVERLAALTARLRAAGLAFSGISAVVTLLIIVNAMRIATYARREEVAIMKLVGATNWFIRTPFLIMGVLAAGIATAVAWVLTFPVLRVATPTLVQLLGPRGVDVATFFRQHGMVIAGAEFLGLALLTTLIAAIAIRRYLRV